MRIFIPLFILLSILFCTVRLPAQTAGNQQVSPVSNLSGSNSSVINNNEQILQANVNGLFYLLSTYFPGGILQTNMGGTGNNFSTTASGDTLVFVNQGVLGAVVPTISTPHGIQYFIASGTFTAPTGVTQVYVTMIGGGASGQNTTGGNSGFYLIDYPYTVVAGSNYTVTIGNGGAAAAGPNNGAGTTFDLITVPGGGNSGSNAYGISVGFIGTSGGSSPFGQGAASGQDAISNTGCGGGKLGGSGGSGGSGMVKIQW